MTPADLMRTIAAHEAAAEACRALLRAEARREWDAGVKVTWDMPGVALLTVPLSKDAAKVVDGERFMDWFAARYPGEVKTTTVEKREARAPAFVAALLAGFKPVDPDEIDPGQETMAMDREGEIIPGVTWRKGGAVLTPTLKIDAGLQKRLAVAAASYARDGAPWSALATNAPQGALQGAVDPTGPV